MAWRFPLPDPDICSAKYQGAVPGSLTRSLISMVRRRENNIPKLRSSDPRKQLREVRVFYRCILIGQLVGTADRRFDSLKYRGEHNSSPLPWRSTMPERRSIRSVHPTGRSRTRCPSRHRLPCFRIFPCLTMPGWGEVCYVSGPTSCLASVRPPIRHSGCGGGCSTSTT